MLPEGQVGRIAARWTDLIDCQECDVDPDEKPMLRQLAGDPIDLLPPRPGRRGRLLRLVDLGALPYAFVPTGDTRAQAIAA
jgi:hypothetical protein